MKRCPECRRDYYDDTLNFCLDDGTPLLDGPAAADQVTVFMPSHSAENLTEHLNYSAEPDTAIFNSSFPPVDLRNSIAVLPLVNMSADAENEYFCDGLAEELINALARVEDLKVVARTSAFSFKGKNVDIAQIGSILNVRNIVEGSVRKFGDRMRITMQLVNAADGYHVWSDKYDTEMRDIFDVQDDITRSVVNALKLKLLGRESSEDEMMTSLIEELQHHSRDVEAYQLYLRGRYFLNKFNAENFNRALECFNQAISIEPGFAEAYAGLADSHLLLTEMGPVPAREGMPRAKEAALKALALDGSLSEAHSSLGLILSDYDLDFAGAEREFLRAIELNPNNSSAFENYGHMLARLGRHREAEKQFKKALEVDPLSVIGNWLYGFVLMEGRRYEDCIAQTQKTLDLDPDFPAAFLTLAITYHILERHEESVEAYARFGELCGSVETAEIIRKSYADGGWEGFLRAMTASYSSGLVSNYIIAVFYAALGDIEGAIEKLQASFDVKEAYIVMLKVDPRLDDLRDDPRFRELYKKIGFPE